MAAAVYHGRGDVRIETRPIPIATEGQALVKVLRSGICGTDATEWKSGPIMFPIDRPHPVSGHHGPLVIGHEFVGEIVDLPAARSTDSPSATDVASGAGVSCGECAAVPRGPDEPLRPLRDTRPQHRRRSRRVRRRRHLDARPDPATTARWMHAGVAQPLAVGLHAARRAGVQTATASSFSAPARSARSSSPASSRSPTPTSPSLTSQASGWIGRFASVRRTCGAGRRRRRRDAPRRRRTTRSRRRHRGHRRSRPTRTSHSTWCARGTILGVGLPSGASGSRRAPAGAERGDHRRPPWRTSAARTRPGPGDPCHDRSRRRARRGAYTGWMTFPSSSDAWPRGRSAARCCSTRPDRRRAERSDEG